MEERLGSRFRLITQNVDGLHLRAGNTSERTYQVHGNLNYMRCSRERCADAVYPLPESLPRISRGDDLSASTWGMLICPKCKSMTRPHVLLWDEYYDEPHYRFESSLDAAGKTALLIVAGTTGSANLPNQVVSTVLRLGAAIIDINPDFNIFSEAAQRSPGGLFLQAAAQFFCPCFSI